MYFISARVAIAMCAASSGSVFGTALDAISPKASSATRAYGAITTQVSRSCQYRMVFLSANVSQPEVSVFLQQDEIAERYGIFFQCLANALLPQGALPDTLELKVKAGTLICALNGVAHNLITISDYPWEKPDKLVATVVRALSKH